MKYISLLVILSLFWSGVSSCSGDDGYVRVVRVVDGDTFEIAGGERVRLIGVDTPETVKPGDPVERFGPEASSFAKKTIEGKEVRLVLDVQERDRYGRILAYVYLRDGTFLNAELLRMGLAQVMTVPPNVRFAGEFLEIQRAAQQAGTGMWVSSEY
jgi:micrococcal nuclease